MDCVVWNPLVETFVHPASKVIDVAEPSPVTELVMRCQMLVERKEEHSHTLRFTLPPEIWLIIFDIVLAPVLRTHELANSDTIPTTSRTIMRFGTRVLKYDDWPRLRLVCKLFRDLLGPNRYQGIRGASDDRALPIGIEALSMIVEDELLATLVALRDPNTLSKLRLLDVTLMDGTSSDGTAQGAMDYLYTIAPTLWSLRSLSVYFSGINRSRVLRDDTWEQIAQSFPLLEDLCLWAYEDIIPSKPVILKNIESLSIRYMPINDLIRFPSLLYVYTFAWNPDGAFEVLHAPKLISLTSINAFIPLNPKALHRLPNVRHVGGSIFSLADVEIPPPGHPIDHFSVVLEDDIEIGTMLERGMPQLVLKLMEIPTVHKLSFGREHGLPPGQMKYITHLLRNTNVESIFTELFVS